MSLREMAKRHDSLQAQHNSNYESWLEIHEADQQTIGTLQRQVADLEKRLSSRDATIHKRDVWIAELEARPEGGE